MCAYIPIHKLLADFKSAVSGDDRFELHERKRERELLVNVCSIYISVQRLQMRE